MDEKTIKQFALCELPVTDWLSLQYKTRDDAKFKTQVNSIIQSLAEGERQTIERIHEVLNARLPS